MLLGQAQNLLRHRVNVNENDGPNDAIVFKWHWPRNTFDKRMSAWEIASFVIPHMPHILPFLDAHPRIKQEFEAILVLLATSPRAAIDEVVPWIRPLVRTQENDLLILELGSRVVQTGPTHFVMGGR